MFISTSDIISNSWELYRKHWRYLAIYMFFVFLPTLLMSILGAFGVYLNNLIPSSTIITNIIISIVFIASLVFNVWTFITLTYAFKNILVEKNELPWKNAFNHTTNLIWPFAYTSILVGLIVFGGTLLLIIPGIIFSLWYAFASIAVIIDGERGLAALKLSKKLVSGRWWKIAIRLFLPSALFTALSVITANIITLPLVAISNKTIQSVIGGGLTSFVNALVTPLTIAAIIILYQSAKDNPATPPDNLS